MASTKRRPPALQAREDTSPTTTSVPPLFSSEPRIADVSKATLRRTARARRLEEGRPEAARALAALASPLFKAGDVVAGYAAINGEIDPLPLMAALHERQMALALPAIEAKGAALVFRAYRPGDALMDGHHGTREPAASAAIVSPNAILVPLLLFDRQGHRLGYGGGYYDRTLAQLRRTASIRAIGLAFSFQEIDALPRDAHDVQLDMVVTELGVHRFGALA